MKRNYVGLVLVALATALLGAAQDQRKRLFDAVAFLGSLPEYVAFGVKRDTPIAVRNVRLSPKADISNYLEVATAPSWMSIPSLSRQTHSSASFPSRMRNIVSDDQVTTLPSATA